MTATLGLILFLLGSLATAVAAVIAGAGTICAVLVGGWLWWRRRNR